MDENQENIELSRVESTRFRVQMVNATENETKPEEDSEKQETLYGRSLKYLTREALPRLDNYRHIMSIQAAYRPTLEDLHNPVAAQKFQSTIIPENEDLQDPKEMYGLRNPSSVELGWMEGVLIPNLLNICGSVLFLQFIRIVIHIGLVESVLLIVFSGVVSIITALSVCAISTNGFTKGGTYAMMSRSLGPEFGIPIGILLLIGNIGLCAMYVVGLVEYIVDSTSCCFFDCDIRDARYFSVATFLIAILLVVISFAFKYRFSLFLVKIRIGLFALLTVTFAYFIINLYTGIDGTRIVAFNVSVVEENLFAKSSERDDRLHLFFTLFAVVYPAFAEFLGGINASENLKDPLRAIPKGTILSVLIAVLVYTFTAIVIAGTVVGSADNIITANTGNDSSLDVTSTCLNFVCQRKRPILHLMKSESSGALVIIRTVVVLATVYCILTNCKTAIASLKVFSADKLYPRFSCFSSQFSQQAGLFAFIITAGLVFIAAGKMSTVGTTVSIILLAAYTLVNFSTFHISLIQPIGWRPTFKKYSMWISLCGSVLCLCIIFLISWVTALVTVLLVLAMYLLVTYQKPDVNWGSSTQAQMYNNALLSVYALNSITDHVKNYRPQVLVLSGLPSNRPPLVTFARLITKNLSLMICGNIHNDQVPQKKQNEYTVKARNWLKFNRIKAFYAQVDEVTFEEGAKSLMQATGLGKLRPNVLLMGYKNKWTSSLKKDVDMYFNTIHKALDSHIAVCILRVKTGLDFSDLKVNHEQISKVVPRPSVKYEFRNVSNQLVFDRGNCDETDLRKSGDGNAEKVKNGQLSAMSELNDSYEDIVANDIYKYKNGTELSGDMISRVTMFQGKQKKGTIDVWWLYDDGGLTLLLPYIISTRRSWASCKLRVFALSGTNDTLEFEQRNMASLLSKFRIDYSDLTIFSGLTKKPQEETKAFYENLVKDFVSNSTDVVAGAEEKITINESDLSTMQDKTNRHLRLRELLLEHSQDANLIVMTLPIPRKTVISAALYMSWLEALTQDMPPFLLVRGNQTSVLTFYS